MFNFIVALLGIVSIEALSSNLKGIECNPKIGCKNKSFVCNLWTKRCVNKSEIKDSFSMPKKCPSTVQKCLFNNEIKKRISRKCGGWSPKSTRACEDREYKMEAAILSKKGCPCKWESN